ncbi:unnamed protein product [Tenebrio molitor]|nr:unnamed protein product [Tenebrio molitor]
MSVIKNTILLFKSDKTDDTRDEYQNLLELNNFKVMMVKTLTFQYKNLDILREKLLNPDGFSGMILSSPRCVNAVSQALSKDKLEELWNPKSNFTVGETTCKEAIAKLSIHCKGKWSGNAKNLSQLIIQNKSEYVKPFLFPHGNLKTDILKVELSKENLAIEEVLVYDTLPNPSIERDLLECTDRFTTIPEFLVFFSPSGLHSSLEYLRKIPVDLNLVKLIAIGPVTELAVIEQNLKVYGVAKSPTPEEVLKAIL